MLPLVLVFSFFFLLLFFRNVLHGLQVFAAFLVCMICGIPGRMGEKRERGGKANMMDGAVAFRDGGPSLRRGL
jgi:hypothetical protein